MRLFTKDRSFYKDLITLAIPISLQNLITFAVNFADNVMIGTLGENAISGVYVASQVQTVIQIFIAGIEGAILILAAQYWGKRDTDSIRKVVSIGVRSAFFIGLAVTLVSVLFPRQIVSLFTSEVGVIEAGADYLQIVGFTYLLFSISQVMIAAMRSVETAKIGLYISIIALVLNIGLNYLFIFGVNLGGNQLIPAMGVQGAALATLISRFVEMAVGVVYVFVIDKKLKFAVKDLFHTDMPLLKDFFRYGMPIMGGQIVWAVNMLANTKIMGSYNAGVIAATSIAGMLFNLIYVWLNGLASAVGIITGKTVGKREFDKMKDYAVTTQVIFLLVGFASSAVLFFLRDPFVALYDTSPEGAMYAKQFINVLMVTGIGTSYQFPCLFGLVKSGGDISFVFKNDTIFVFLVVLPLAFLANHLGAAPWVVFAALKSDQVLKCFVAIVKINRFNWMKDLTRAEGQ